MIRDYIKNNFKGTSETEIEQSIISSINEGEEVSLPGLGVLFEITWKNCNNEIKKEILRTIKNNL